MNIKQQSHQSKKERKEERKKEKEVEQTRKIQTRKTKNFLTRNLVILAILASGFGLWRLSQQTTAPLSSADSADILQIKDNDWVKGNPNSTVTLIEYLDFECEACGAYYPLVKQLSEEYIDDILFVSRYFPLPGHRNSMTSALAIEAAGKQGKYWEMHDLLFEEQQNWGERPSAEPSIFEGYAERLGLDMERFKQDVNSQEAKDRVEEDRNAGVNLGVNGTPSFFLNGEKIDNPRGYEAFKSLLENSLNQ